MFESSLVESTNMLRTRNRWTVVVSITAQCALLAALVIIPLMHPEIIPLHAMKLSTIPPPPTPKPPVPPPQPVVMHAAASTSAPSAPGPATVAFTTILHPHFGPVTNEPTAAFNIGVGNMGDPSLPAGLGVGGPGNGTNPNISVVPAKSNKPLNISSGVSAGMLISPIQPIYPAIAKIMHKEGTVIVHAVITKTGRIESAQVISGPDVLARAALDAVRNAHYHPYLLNNEPTEVETTFSIVFHMSS